MARLTNLPLLWTGTVIGSNSMPASLYKTSVVRWVISQTGRGEICTPLLYLYKNQTGDCFLGSLNSPIVYTQTRFRSVEREQISVQWRSRLWRKTMTAMTKVRFWNSIILLLDSLNVWCKLLDWCKYSSALLLQM